MKEIRTLRSDVTCIISLTLDSPFQLRARGAPFESDEGARLKRPRKQSYLINN